MRRSAAASSWWDHSHHPSSSPPGAFHEYTTYDDSYNRIYYDHHSHLSLDRYWMNAGTTMDSQQPPPDAVTQMLSILEEDAADATPTMSVTEEALRNCRVEQQEERRQREQQLASPAQLQLFSPAHRQEFLQHHPFAFYPPLHDPYLLPAASTFPMHNAYPAFVPTMTRKRAPTRRKRVASPKKTKAPVETSSLGSSLAEKEENTIPEKQSTKEEAKATVIDLKPVPDDHTTTSSSKCDSQAQPAVRCIKPQAKKPRPAGVKKPTQLSALSSLTKHDVSKAMQWIAIPPPPLRLIPPTPTPTKKGAVPILPRGRVISPWSEDAAPPPRSAVDDDDDDPLLHLMREDDIWSLSSSTTSDHQRPPEEPPASTKWNDDPEMVTFLCDALDL
jgi:hypothetical protein